jgi:hypothetical protein
LSIIIPNSQKDEEMALFFGVNLVKIKTLFDSLEENEYLNLYEKICIKMEDHIEN